MGIQSTDEDKKHAESQAEMQDSNEYYTKSPSDTGSVRLFSSTSESGGQNPTVAAKNNQPSSGSPPVSSPAESTDGSEQVNIDDKEERSTGISGNAENDHAPAAEQADADHKTRFEYGPCIRRATSQPSFIHVSPAQK